MNQIINIVFIGFGQIEIYPDVVICKCWRKCPHVEV